MQLKIAKAQSEPPYLDQAYRIPEHVAEILGAFFDSSVETVYEKDEPLLSDIPEGVKHLLDELHKHDPELLFKLYAREDRYIRQREYALGVWFLARAHLVAQWVDKNALTSPPTSIAEMKDMLERQVRAEMEPRLLPLKTFEQVPWEFAP